PRFEVLLHYVTFLLVVFRAVSLCMIAMYLVRACPLSIKLNPGLMNYRWTSNLLSVGLDKLSSLTCSLLSVRWRVSSLVTSLSFHSVIRRGCYSLDLFLRDSTVSF